MSRLASTSEEDLSRLVDDHAFHKEASVTFSDWQASAILNPSRDAAMGLPQLEEYRPGSRSGPRHHKTPIAPHHAGSAKFYTPPIPRHIFENVPEPVAVANHGKLAVGEWENEVARSVLALYRADVSRRAGASAPIAAHLAYREPELPPTSSRSSGDAAARRDVRGARDRLPRSGLKHAAAIPSEALDEPSEGMMASFGDLAVGESLSAASGTSGWHVPPTESTPSDVLDSRAHVESEETVEPAAATRKKKVTRRRRVKSATPKPATPDARARSMLVQGPPTNRHGDVLPTIQGGTGGSGGFAKLRGGPYPVWFGGSGSPISSKTVWCALAGVHVEGLPPELTSEEIMIAVTAGQCIHSLCNALAALEREGKYSDYIEALVPMLLPAVRTETPRSEILDRQWRQLLAAGHVFALNYTEEGRFGPALLMLRRVQQLMSEDMMMDSRVAKELRAFIDDAYAFYYYSRGKYQAALQCANKAMRAHAALGQWQHVAKCQLHTGVLLSRQRQHGEAIRCNGQVLQMVDEGKLEGTGADSEKICMIAVCYHNTAVDHLLLQQIQEACVASQNARRLARLCMAYSNRYMRFFESTHGAALDALAKTKDVKESFRTREERKLFKNLSADLYS